MLISVNERERKARVSLMGPKILPSLQTAEAEDPKNHLSKWRPEYGCYVIEGERGERV